MEKLNFNKTNSSNVQMQTFSAKGRAMSPVVPKLTPDAQEFLTRTLESMEKERSIDRMLQKIAPARLHHWQGFLKMLMFHSDQRVFFLGENKFVEENNAFYTQKVNVFDFKTPTEVMVVALHQALLNYTSKKGIALPDVLKNVFNYSCSFALDEMEFWSYMIYKKFTLFKSELEKWRARLDDLKDARDLTCCHYLKCARAILDIILFQNGNHDKLSSARAERHLESEVSKELIPFIYEVVRKMPANDNVVKVGNQLFGIMPFLR